MEGVESDVYPRLYFNLYFNLYFHHHQLSNYLYFNLYFHHHHLSAEGINDCHGVRGDYWIMSRDVAVGNAEAFCKQERKVVKYNIGSVNELELSVFKTNDNARGPLDDPRCLGCLRDSVIDGCDGNGPKQNPHDYKFGSKLTSSDGWVYELKPLSKKVNEVSCDVTWKFIADEFEIRGKNVPDVKIGANGEGLKKQIQGCGALTAWGFWSTPYDIKFQWRMPLFRHKLHDGAAKVVGPYLTVSCLTEILLNWVRSVAFASNGGRVASASDDRTVKIWDAATGTLQSTLEGSVTLNYLLNNYDKSSYSSIDSVNELELSAFETDDNARGPLDDPRCLGRLRDAVIDGCDGNDPKQHPHNYKFGSRLTSSDGWVYEMEPLSKQVNQVSCDESYKFFFDFFEIRGKNLPDGKLGPDGEGLKKELEGCGKLTQWNFEQTPQDVKFQWYAKGHLPIGGDGQTLPGDGVLRLA
ncbi:hypothetical protein MY4038_009779 [Beauveria bassiana]